MSSASKSDLVAMLIYPKQPSCRRLAETERAQIDLDRSQPGLPRSIFRFYIASFWEDPECRPEEIENGLDWYRHDRGDLRKTGAADG